MNNQDVLAIREFRRFANAHIYPTTIYIIMTNIQQYIQSNCMQFEPLPQPMLKFDDGVTTVINNTSQYTEEIHTMLKNTLIQFFNNADIVKLIRNKIYTEIPDEETKQLLNLALLQIQAGNPQYMGLLFNLTILQQSNIYLYL